jgi:GNAT superfamily N-acetyltransferase
LSSSTDVEIRPVAPGEAAALRDLRLRALADAPGAFARTLADEAAHPSSHWVELAGAMEVFVAINDDRWVGMAAGRWYDQDSGVAQLWGLWVDPCSRGSGLGAQLVAAVDRWAAAHGARVLRLGIIMGGADVEGFYTRLGFARTGEILPLPWDESRIALFLARPVTGASL